MDEKDAKKTYVFPFENNHEVYSKIEDMEQGIVKHEACLFLFAHQQEVHIPILQDPFTFLLEISEKKEFYNIFVISHWISNVLERRKI